MQSFQEKVYSTVKKIPRGRVSTYTSIARAAGHPRSARAVGNALNRNLYRDTRLQRQVPCHRVVRSDGTIGGFARGSREKIRLLRKEGVVISNDKALPKFILRSLG